MTTPVLTLDPLYKAKRDAVSFVDVPELAYLVYCGKGEPSGSDFTSAVQTLYSASYGAHFLAKKLRGDAPRVMPLEALWWADDMSVFTTDAGKQEWQWQAMIVQLPPIDQGVVDAAVDQATKKLGEAAGRLRFELWAEGLCAQTLHVGPYSAEAATIAMLHTAIVDAGYVLRGRHHEIYLGDPRRCAPEKLRTILRQPVGAG